MLSQLKNEMQALSNPEKAKILGGFFKTGKGQYGEGDVFLGIVVPEQRKVAKKFWNQIELEDIQELLNSKIHEHRMVGLLILMQQYKKAKKDSLKKLKIFEFYLKNTKNINNWDLVDLSAPNIIGDYLQKEGTDILKQLARSENLWERRIAIVSTFPFIRKRSFGETLAISDMLLKDEHDLIHKAVGWMLREVGKRNKNVLELFLEPRYKEMPRTMLRYSIEKFSKEERDKWMKR